MAHYALLDENNIVINVIPGPDENNGVDWEEHYEETTGYKCKRTSISTFNNTNIYPDKEPFRGNYAGVGYSYSEEHDIFLPPKPDDDFVLSVQYATWIPPVPYPEVDEDDGFYYIWNKQLKSWIKTTPKQ